ncbi:hypothetical protein M2451_003913 [Dysgonomonas sp. PFB1-18]|nr:hypothetical protein [Dysgonomonas sp. PF1-14]MDH6337873.1 hypothetical protein [Dysgonomonas sp. PF1-16]MDH6382572.1 hypothetical protein [Dysgonomonas sp. PFB1-18]MDH6398005.1 hypothetical protein [Dysgonomonas sp. PF1-23]
MQREILVTCNICQVLVKISVSSTFMWKNKIDHSEMALAKTDLTKVFLGITLNPHVKRRGNS